MKNLLTVTLVLTMVLCFLTGCTQGELAQIQGEGVYTEEPTVVVDEPAFSTDAVIKKVALITDCGTVDDRDYNQACWQGVESRCTALGIPYTYYQPEEYSTDARVLSIDQAVAEGANVIVMPGYSFSTALIETQEKYPDVYFIAVDVGEGDMTYDYVDYYKPTANAVCLTFAEEQAGYLAGYAAVKDGYTNLAFMGGMAVPAIMRYGHGFMQGADAAAAEMNVDIYIKYTYMGLVCGCDGYAGEIWKLQSWKDSGTEIAFVCGAMAPDLAENVDIPVIGVDVDMAHHAPNIVSSAVKELQTAVEISLTDLYEGRWESDYSGQFKVVSLEDGDFVGLPTGESWRFRRFTTEEYETLKNDIRTGIKIVSSDVTSIESIDCIPAPSGHTTIEAIG